jgi:hypothetical protein
VCVFSLDIFLSKFFSVLNFVPEVSKVVTGRFFLFFFFSRFFVFCVTVALKGWMDGWMVGDEYGFYVC